MTWDDHVDKVISIAILSPFVVLMFQYLIMFYFNLGSSGLGSIIQIISKVIVGLFYLSALKYVLRRKSKLFIIVYYLFLIVILFNFLFYSDNINSILSILFHILFISAPTFIYMVNIKNLDVFKKTLVKTSDVILILGIIFLIMNITGNHRVDDYSMSLGYYLLWPLLVNLLKFLKGFRLLYLFNFILMLFTIISTGSRGPLLSFLVLMFLYLIINYNNKTHKGIVIGLVFFLLSGLVTYNYRFLIEKLSLFFNSLGIKSRTLNLFLDTNPGLHLSGREKIYEKSLMLINNKPFLGWGLTGEVNALNTYAHNVFIEIFISFGIIIGSIVIVVIFYLLLKAFLRSNYQVKELIILLFAIGFVPLLVSGTYLTSIQFWILLGLIVNIIINRNYCNNLIEKGF